METGAQGQTSGERVVDLDEARRLREQSEARAREEAERDAKEGGGDGGDGISTSFVLDCLAANELGDGLLYQAIHRGRFIFNHTTGEWLRWAGHHWEIAEIGEAKGAVEAVALRYLTASEALWDEIMELKRSGRKDEAKGLERHQMELQGRAKRLRSDNGQNKTLTMAATNGDDPLAVTEDMLDANPWLLGCDNCVIDLRTGVARPGRPDDWILKACPVGWHGLDACRAPWEDALWSIYEDEEKIAFAQRLFGYAITGLSVEHVLPIFWGIGRNGKGVIFGVLQDVLGPLCQPVPAELLLDQGKNSRSSASPSPDIMALKGLRIAYGSETDEGRKISTSRAKWLSGGDMLVGKFPYDKRLTTFKPSHLLFLITNNLPKAPSSDFAFWERCLRFDHPHCFVDREPVADHEFPQDKSLPAELAKVLPGVLAWLVEGCLLWQRYGLAPPASVIAATDEYKRHEDIVAEFVDQCCYIPEPRDLNVSVGATELYDAFVSWYEKYQGKLPPKQRKFGDVMSADTRFDRRKDGKGLYRYYGIGLLDDKDRGPGDGGGDQVPF